MICVKKLRFSSGPKAKVSRQEPLGSATAQPRVWRKIIVCPTAMLSPINERGIGWEIRQINTRNKH